MLDPLKISIAVNLIFMVGFGTAAAVAWIHRADALFWRREAAGWRTKANIARRKAVAFRSSVPPPTGHKGGLPYWDAYELNRFAERSA